MATNESRTSTEEARLASLHDEIAALRQRHFNSAQAASAAAPKSRACPSCGASMERGRISIHGGPLKGLFVFLNSETLAFDPQDGRASETVLTARHSELAWRCTKCEAMLLEPGVQRTENP